MCDLQSLLGYSPEELQAMVAQQQQQQQSASTPTLEQSMQDSTSATPPMSQQSLKREVDWLFPKNDVFDILLFHLLIL